MQTNDLSISSHCWYNQTLKITYKSNRPTHLRKTYRVCVSNYGLDPSWFIVEASIQMQIFKLEIPLIDEHFILQKLMNQNKRNIVCFFLSHCYPEIEAPIILLASDDASFLCFSSVYRGDWKLDCRPNNREAGNIWPWWSDETHAFPRIWSLIWIWQSIRVIHVVGEYPTTEWPAHDGSFNALFLLTIEFKLDL